MRKSGVIVTAKPTSPKFTLGFEPLVVEEEIDISSKLIHDVEEEVSVKKLLEISDGNESRTSKEELESGSGTEDEEESEEAGDGEDEAEGEDALGADQEELTYSDEEESQDVSEEFSSDGKEEESSGSSTVDCCPEEAVCCERKEKSCHSNGGVVNRRNEKEKFGKMSLGGRFVGKGEEEDKLTLGMGNSAGEMSVSHSHCLQKMPSFEFKFKSNSDASGDGRVKMVSVCKSGIKPMASASPIPISSGGTSSSNSSNSPLTSPQLAESHHLQLPGKSHKAGQEVINQNNVNVNTGLTKPTLPSKVKAVLLGGCGTKLTNNIVTETTATSVGHGNANVFTANTSATGLPPIPPSQNINIPTNDHHQQQPQPVQQPPPAKPTRVSLAVHPKSSAPRIKSPSRTAGDEFPLCSPPLSSKPTGKKKLGGKRYASSLPDQERNLAGSPLLNFDLNSYLCHQQKHGHHHNQGAGQPHASSSAFRGHPRPTKHCKSKHLWARASLERDVFTNASISPSASIGNCNNSHSSFSHASSNSSNNRHSSYHPTNNFGMGGLSASGAGGGGSLGSSAEAAAASVTAAEAAAAAAAAAYNAHMFFSRPTSPLFMDSASYCGAGEIGGSGAQQFCMGCAAKTFPRVNASSSRSANYGLCHCCHHHATGSGGMLGGSLVGLDYEDRLLRLESDKDTLHLQVSVLSDQIEAQTNKIQDLEKLLEDKRNVLETTEDQLQRELLTRSSLETQKLELMTEISSLRLKHASLERENIELKDRFGGKSTNDLTYIDGGGRIWDKPPLGPSGRASPGQSGIIDSSTSRGRLGSNSSDNGQLTMGQQPPTRVRTPPANAYRRIDQSAFGTLPRRSPHSSQLTTFNGGISGHSPEGQHKSSKSNSLSSGNINVVSNFSSLTNGSLHHLSTNANNLPFQQQFLLQHQQIQKIPSIFYPQKASGQQKGVGVVGGASSVAVAYPPYGAYGYSSSTTTTSDINPNSGNRSTSAPNLAAIERDDWERRNQGSNSGSNVNSKKSPSGGHKSRGIMRILGKLRRSNSGGLDNEIAPESGGPFTRGGLRATAAPRLGWMREPSPLRKPEGPISAWDSEGVVMWLNYLGLGMYAGEVKRWVKTGQQMLDASVHELEKELGIKNQLHRKKLSLAVHYLKNPDEEDNAGKLDYHWVIRWLDDVGLPQYKESFGEARIDGRILSHLTTEDLLTLKVTSVLHHASIKRGIQLLRIHKFHPGCLCRRGGPNPGSVNGNTNGSSGNNNGSSTESGSGSLWGPKHVATWTNHRVMEWLKAIDLAEYAPNLRGSGVHGALVILESRFNAELLATLLAIPGNKTLLRRHLSLQFNELVGRHIVQEKRLVEIAPEFVPIHPTTKVKTAKKSQFPLRKKRLSTEMTDELLCPVDLNVYPFNSDSMGQISVNENSVDGPAKGEGKVSNI